MYATDHEKTFWYNDCFFIWNNNKLLTLVTGQFLVEIYVIVPTYFKAFGKFKISCNL